jgi:ketosteroid isomerase-like protein
MLRALSLCGLVGLFASSALAQAEDAVGQVLALNEDLEAAVASGDPERIAEFFSPEFHLHNSANRIFTADEVLDQFRSGTTRFSDYERKVETAYASGDVVVLMGEERVKPTRSGKDRNAAALLTRRFTSVWGRTPAGWRQIARQSSNVVAQPPE